MNDGLPTTDTVRESPSFEDFFHQHFDSLYRMLSIASGSASEGEELAQEAMARAYEHWERVRGVAHPEGYVYVMGLNLQRRRWRVANRLTLVGQPEGAVVSDFALASDAHADLVQAISRLPISQKQVIVLVHWLGLSTEETARLLRIRPGSVRARLHRARSKLYESLGGTYG